MNDTPTLNKQHMDDVLREKRIDRMRRQASELHNQGKAAEANGIYRLMVAECNSRSPEQVARMERARGL